MAATIRAVQAGMIMLEMLVALVVTGMLLGVMLPAMTYSSERLALVEMQARARGLAAVQLERLLLVRGDESVVGEGRDGDLRWKVTETEVRTGGVTTDRKPISRGVVVEITDPKGLSLVHIESVRAP